MGAHYYEFDEFRLEPDKLRLLRNGEVVRITPKALEILHLLVRNHGRTVTRDDMLESVWKDTFIEEGNINFTVSQLRKSLRMGNAGSPEYIRTIPKQGYRFVAEVREVTVGSSASDPVTTRRDVRWNLGVFIRRPIFQALFFLLCAAVVGGFWAAGSRWTFGSGAKSRQISSIAVLPLINLDESSQNNGLRIAITDNLISRLGKLNRFAIRPLSSVERFESSGKDAVKFAEELRVEAVLEGTIQQRDGRLRVNVRLVDIRDGSQIWTKIFDESDRDIFRLQDVLSESVARSLVTDLSAREKLALSVHPTDNLDAYDYYLKGRALWSKRGSNIANSIMYFEKAIELDPQFALAYVGRADAYAMRETPTPAEADIGKALAIDPTLAEAHATLGFIRMFHYFDWDAAENELRSAIDLAPNYATGHHWLGVLYSIRGRLDDAKTEMLRARDLDPTSPIILNDLGQVYGFAGEYARAIEILREASEVDPANPWPYGTMIDSYRALGNSDEALKSLKTWHRLTSGDAVGSDRIFQESEIRSADDFWRRTVVEISAYLKSNPNAISTCEPLVKFNLRLGNKTEALRYLDCLFEQGNRFTIAYLGVDPLYDPIRSDPKFQAILRKMNL